MTDDLEMRRRLREAVRRNLPALESSSIFLAIFSRSYEDDALAVLQFGLAVLMDKPIYLVVERGREIPENVKRLCRRLEYYDPNDKAATLEEATKAIIASAVSEAVPKGGG